MLPFLAMLLFALLGIGALIVDGGLALTEQARLETTAEMVASEWTFVQSTPEVWPSACRTRTGDDRRRCLEAEYVAPLLAPLGVERAEGSATEEWRRADAALDGVAIDSRGVRLGELEAPDVDFADDASAVRLARSSPLIFGWAAIAPETAGGVVSSFEALQAARNGQGLSPDDSGGGGIYGEGFALEANAVVDLRGALALWAGPPIANPSGDDTATQDDDYLTGGVVPIAWRLDQLGALDTLLGSSGDAPISLRLDSDRRTLTTVDESGDPVDDVACRVESTATGIRVGEALEAHSDPVGSPIAGERWRAAYLPVFQAWDCLSEPGPPVLGFLEVAVDTQSALDSITMSPSAGLRRNVAALPPAALDAAAASDFVTELMEANPPILTESFWRYALRAPSPASLGAGSGLAQAGRDDE
ncbi:MAG: hypothetical protein AAGC67_11655 [Myxococcota bacterium]